MSNLSILIKNNFRMFVRSLKSSKKLGKLFASWIFFAVIGIFLVTSMVAGAVGQTTMFIELGAPELSLYYAVCYTLIILLLMAILRGTTLPKTTDADFLLSLPVTRREVIVSKSVSKYIFEMIPVAVFFLPYMGAYFALVDTSALFLVKAILVFLLMPLISVGVSYILNFIMFKIGNAFSNPQMVTSILTLGVLGVYMYINFKMNGSMGENAETIRAFYESFAPFIWIVSFLWKSSLTGLLLTAAITIIPYAVGVALFAAIFGAKQRMWHSKNKNLEFRMRTPLGALYKKEFKRYASSSVYIVNSIIGPLMCVAFSVLIVIRGSLGAEFNSIFAEPFVIQYLPIILIVLYSFVAAMTVTAACSISLEGKAIFTLRANPILEKDIFLAKILVNVTLSAPLTAIGSLAAGISLGFSAAQLIATAVIPTLVAVLISVMGLYVNLVFPKLEWDNEAMVVKQSTSVMIAVFGGMLLAGIPALFFFLTNGLLSFTLGALILAALLALIIYGAWRLIMTDGKKRFNELY